MLFVQVLWISDDGLPDLGGINGEENCFVDEVRHIYIWISDSQLFEAFNVFIFSLLQSLTVLHS